MLTSTVSGSDLVINRPSRSRNRTYAPLIYSSRPHTLFRKVTSFSLFPSAQETIYRSTSLHSHPDLPVSHSIRFHEPTFLRFPLRWIVKTTLWVRGARLVPTPARSPIHSITRKKASEEDQTTKMRTKLQRHPPDRSLRERPPDCPHGRLPPSFPSTLQLPALSYTPNPRRLYCSTVSQPCLSND